MNRFPDIQTEMTSSDTPASESSATDEAPAHHGHEATTEQPAMTGVLEPNSGGQVFILVSFGFLAFIMLVAMTRYCSSKNYGD